MNGFHYHFRGQGDEDNCGDVEYLPAIAEALVLIDDREAAFHAKWAAKMGGGGGSGAGGGGSSAGGSNAGVGRSKAVASTVAAAGVEADTRIGKETETGIGAGTGVGVEVVESVVVGGIDATTTPTPVTASATATTAPSLMHHYALYQGCQGELVFLHPMCSKCLLVAGEKMIQNMLT